MALSRTALLELAREGLRGQLAEIDQELSGLSSSATRTHNPGKTAAPAKKKASLSKEAREAIARAQKERWSKKRQADEAIAEAARAGELQGGDAHEIAYDVVQQATEQPAPQQPAETQAPDGERPPAKKRPKGSTR